VAEDTESQPAAPQDPPEGIYPARVDEKGRLKLPEDFKAFLQTLSEKSFFVTTFDVKIAKVYPMQAWRASKKLLEDEQENPEAAENLLFVAAEYGGATGLDAQGRLLVPLALRRALEIENRPAYVMWNKNCVEVYSEDYRRQRLEAARTTSATDLAYMRRKGLK
jgi:MraZ protein